LGAGDKLS